MASGMDSASAVDGDVEGGDLLSAVEALMEAMGEDDAMPGNAEAADVVVGHVRGEAGDAPLAGDGDTNRAVVGTANAAGDVSVQPTGPSESEPFEEEGDSTLMAGLSSLLGGYGSDSEDGASASDGNHPPQAEQGVGASNVVANTVESDAGTPALVSTADASPAPALSPDAPTAAGVSNVELRPGCVVRVHGLRKATDLNGRKGSVRRLDPMGQERWEVELEAASGMPHAVKSIHRQNLEVLADCEASEDLHAATRTSMSSDGELQHERRHPSSDLLPGCKVHIEGLKKVPELNGLHGVIRRADPVVTGRWEIEFQIGETGQRTVKSIKAENLVREDDELLGHVDRGKAIDDPCQSSVEHTKESVEDSTASRPTTIQPGCIVWVEGLQSATALNGRQGTVVRCDAKREGRWEVEFPGSDGAVETKVSIREENLVLDTTEETDWCVADDGYGDVEPETEDEDKDDDDEGMEDAADHPEFDGLEVGASVLITGLCSVAARHLNDQEGTLIIFDPASSRWQVRLRNGDIKGIKPENLALKGAPTGADAKQAQDDGSNQPMVLDPASTIPAASSAPTPKDEIDESLFSEWDANEIAAAVVQAELNGETERATGLKELLKARRAQDASLAARGLEEGPLIEERMEVPEEAVGRVIGQGGESIMRLTAASGARLTITRPDANATSRARICTILGLDSEVVKAKQLLQDAIAAALAALASKGGGKRNRGKGGKCGKGKKGGKGHDLVGEGAGGRAGFEDGICKWYAAGFCRNHSSSGSCRNGLHNSDAAKRAEADWVRAGPDSGSAGDVAEPGRPVLLLLDLEGGGNKDGRDGEDEIIEMPVLSMCPVTGRELGRFHRFIRPGFWDRESASMQRRFAPACFNREASSISFPQAVWELSSWICSLLHVPGTDALMSERFLFVTCGNWDVKTCIPRQCSNPQPGTVDIALQRLLFSRWCNLKEVFREHYRLPESIAPTGMRGMLRRLGLPLAGQHHLGMDDVSNLAKIMHRLVSEGCCLKATGHAAPAAALRPSAPRSFGGGKPGASLGKGKGKGKPGGSSKGKGKGKGSGWIGSGAVARDAPVWGRQPQPAHRPPSMGNPPQRPTLRGFQPTAAGTMPAAKDEDEKVAPVAMQSGISAFLQGAPLPGGQWTKDSCDDSEDESGNEGKAPPASRGHPLWRSRPRPGEEGTLDAQDLYSGTSFGGSKRLRPAAGGEAGGVAGLLAGVLGGASLHRSVKTAAEREAAGGEGPSKVPRISSLLAGLPAPRASSAEVGDVAAEGAPKASALLAGLPAPVAAGGT